MIDIPTDILAQYDAVLARRSVPASQRANFRKWIRYYLDFCAKHDLPDSRQDRVRAFTNKLQQKSQTPEQQKQAAYAVSLYFELLRAQGKAVSIPEGKGSISQPGRLESIQHTTLMAFRGSASAVSRYKKVATVVPAEWARIDQRLAEEIKTRHYSPKTLKAYGGEGSRLEP